MRLTDQQPIKAYREGMTELHSLMLHRLTRGGLSLRELSGVLDNIIANDLINHGYVNLDRMGIRLNAKGEEYLQSLPPRKWEDKL